MPVLKSTDYRGYPRIYVIARKMAEISGGYLGKDNISHMIKAYQEVTPLTERELQVLPEMIGLCLLERIVNVSGEITRVIKAKSKAESFVKEKLEKKHGDIDILSLLTTLDAESSNISFHSHVVYLLKNMLSKKKISISI